MAVYRRLGIQPFGKMISLRESAPMGPEASRRGVGARSGPGWESCDIADLRPASTQAVPGTTALEDKDCDDAFDELDRANQKRFRLYPVGRAYLN
jgi:hypothetical protein